MREPPPARRPFPSGEPHRSLKFLVFSFLCTLSLALAASTLAEPITQDQAADLGRRIQASFAAGDPAVFNEAFDDATLVQWALAGYPIKDQQSREMAEGIKVGKDLANRIVKTVSEGGTYRLLRIDTSKPVPTPIFRLLSQGSLNYHRLRLARDATGAIRIVDVEVFISGEPISATMRRLLLPALVEAQKGKADDVVKPLQDVAAMQRVAAGGDYNMALDLWSKLPQSLRNEKALQLSRLQYAQKVSPEKYAIATADFEKTFPNDPVLDLIRIYSLSAARNYDQALAAVDRLDLYVQDPYLDLFRAQNYAAQKNVAKAQETFDKLLRYDPTCERAWGGVLVIALNKKDFQHTAELLNARERATGKSLPIETIEKAKEFAPFIKSPEYQKWKDSRKGTP